MIAEISASFGGDLLIDLRLFRLLAKDLRDVEDLIEASALRNVDRDTVLSLLVLFLFVVQLCLGGLPFWTLAARLFALPVAIRDAFTMVL